MQQWMKRTCSAFVIVYAISWSATARAADQTETIKAPPRVLENADSFVNAADATMTQNQARSLIVAALPGAPVDDPEFYCVIHVVRSKDKAGEIDKSHWYVYRARGSTATAGGRWTPPRFAGNRIYGSHDIAVLYVHTNVPMRREDAARVELLRTLRALPAGSLLDSSGQPATPEQLVAQNIPIDPAAPLTIKSQRGKTLARVGTFLVEESYLGASYQVDVTKKLPAPIQNLSDALSVGGFLQAAAATDQVSTEPGVLYGGRILEILDVPSDVKVSGRLIVKETQGLNTTEKTFDLGSQTYDNEGLYYWDVSVGLPVRSIKQLNFEAEGGTVFTKEVDKQNMYLMFNVFVRPADTKRLEHKIIPSPLIGIGLSKKPLDTVFTGGSIGLNRVQFFAGAVWVKTLEEQQPGEGANPVPASPTDPRTPRYRPKFMAGINVPARQVAAFLKAKK
jgi:hypothetical protein